MLKSSFKQTEQFTHTVRTGTCCPGLRSARGYLRLVVSVASWTHSIISFQWCLSGFGASENWFSSPTLKDRILRFVDRASVYNFVKPTWYTILLSMFISFLYMSRATMCPPSGEIAVSMWHLVFVTLCGWLSGLQGGMKFIHTEWQIPSVT